MIQSQVDNLIKDVLLGKTILSLEIELDCNGRIVDFLLETTEGIEISINHHGEIDIYTVTPKT